MENNYLLQDTIYLFWLQLMALRKHAPGDTTALFGRLRKKGQISWIKTR